MNSFIETAVHDPMFWAIAVCINVIMLLCEWKQEGSIVLFRRSLVIALIANSVLLGITYAEKYLIG